MRRRSFLVAASFLALTACAHDKPVAEQAPLKIAAAADLTGAFNDVGAAFEKASGQKTVFTFGSTGLLSKQIAEGAPFDLFAAANISFVDDLVKGGHALGDTKTLYARGRLVVWVKSGKAPELKDLTGDAFKKIAIANPEHAPYGKAAQQALTKAGIWEAVKSKMVFGENIQQAQQFVSTGNAEAGIIALSVAIAAKSGSYTNVDPDLHDPLDQALVVCSNSTQKDAAKRFAAFVGSEPGRAIMKRYGFLLPGETASADVGSEKH